MDAAMQARWLAASLPFDGVVLFSPFQKAEAIRLELMRAVPILSASTSAELRTFLDWHEHDGYVGVSEVAPWSALDDAVSHPARFMKWSSDDTFVRRAWCPSDFRFLLRWYVSSDPEGPLLPPPSDPEGDFDLTASRDLIDAVSSVVSEFEIAVAKTYFDAQAC